MLQMYKGAINSPETIITNNISNTDTLIYVQDETKVPTDLPNLMVLGTGISAETIKVLSISGLAITVERAFQGTAKTWNAGTTIARNFTEYDYEALKSNVEELTDNQGDLTLLDTVEQSNLVGAINENTAQLAQIELELDNKCDKVVPTETIITSGFASGWSGEIRIRKTQEGILIFDFPSLIKVGTIDVASEVVYTLPVNLRPKTALQHVFAAQSTVTYSRVQGGLIEVMIFADGTITVANVGSNTTNVNWLVRGRLVGI